MTEFSWPWDGVTTGDAASAPYDAAAEWAELQRLLAVSEPITTYKSGVFRDVDNELVVTSGAGQVTVGSGKACAYGTMYKNDANLPISVPTPGGSARTDWIVLARDTTAKTVRAVRVAGTEGAGTPALSNSGTVFYTKLALVTIQTNGSISVTDQRSYIPYHGDQSGEGGTAHHWNQIVGFPLAPGNSTPIASVYAGGGAVGSDTDNYANDDHQHPTDAGSRGVWVASFNVNGLVSATVVTTLFVASGTVVFFGMLTLANTSPGVGGTVQVSGPSIRYVAGPHESDPTLQKVIHGGGNFGPGAITIYGETSGSPIEIVISNGLGGQVAATGMLVAIKQ